jgi:hypothetical protein
MMFSFVLILGRYLLVILLWSLLYFSQGLQEIIIIIIIICICINVYN